MRSLRTRVFVSTLALGLFVSLEQSFAQLVPSVHNPDQYVDPARYDEIQGSPYMYKNWQPGEILEANGSARSETEINYNGLTGEIEVRTDGEREVLMTGSFLKVTINFENKYDNVFVRGLHPEFGIALACIVFDGQSIQLVKIFQVRKEISTSRGISERFVPRIDYFLIREGQLVNINIRKKKILKELNPSKVDLEAYLKETNNDLKTESDFIDLLKYYDQKN